MVLVTRACNICSPTIVLIARLVERVPVWGGCTCNSYSYTLRAANKIWFSCIKFWRALKVTSHTVLPMLCRSPSIRVIGSIDNFDALTFLCDPVRLVGCWCFNYVDAVCGSMPPSSSSTSYPCEGDIWPSCAFAGASFTTTAAEAFSCSVAVYAVSHAIHSSTATAFFLLSSANCTMHCLTSSFFLCASNFSSFAMSGVRHFDNHVSSILKMTSSMATKGSFLHCFAESSHALMYTLWMSALNSEKLCRMLKTVGDNCSLRLIPILRLISMNTQNILLLQILLESFVAQSEAYFTASDRSLLIVENWLSSGNSLATRTMDNRSHA